MREAKRLLDLTEKIEKQLPPFFDIADNVKSSPKFHTDIKGEKGKNLKRGVSKEMLGSSEPANVRDRDIRILKFRDSRELEEVMYILSTHEDIGHPTFLRGADGKSIIFHFWKADDKMKERMEKAIAVLKKANMLLDTEYNPNYQELK